MKKPNEDSIHHRLKALREAKGLSMAALAEKLVVSWQTIQQWEAGRATPRLNRINQIAEALDTTPDYLSWGDWKPSPKIYGLLGEDETSIEIGRIPMLESRGSCGGGLRIHGFAKEAYLVKEATFFARYKLSPDNAVAVYADGDGMSDFIVDGDIVIFDTSKTELQSGKIFLFEYPNGLRIKQVHQNIDGSWSLQNLHSNKQHYPDEQITSEQGKELRTRGRFVYRQGG